jgi:hypothetical protein
LRNHLVSQQGELFEMGRLAASLRAHCNPYAAGLQRTLFNLSRQFQSEASGGKQGRVSLRRLASSPFTHLVVSESPEFFSALDVFREATVFHLFQLRFPV